MRKWYFIVLVCFVFSCGEKKTDLSGNTPIKINDFNRVFKNTELPVTISDTSLNNVLDTLVIQRKALAQFVPDSIIDQFIDNTNKSKAIIHPLLRIEQEAEYYLLLNIKYPKKHEIVALVFNKKNKYLDFQSITEFLEENKQSTKYEKKLNINREPSFLVEENVISPQGVATYEKNAWAYSDSNFRLIYFDSNKTPENKEVINPIDTISSKNVYSGNYGTDAKNFIALRDYGAPNKYQFFIHFEKRNGSCVGELKGVLNFTNNQATYTEKGDPCIVHFSINGNNIAIKEEGNCGNHRGMKCYFNDKFDKIKKSKKKK
ncbi:MAG: hypothetical protein RI940_727 [Bacteroidota bacterium]